MQDMMNRMMGEMMGCGLMMILGAMVLLALIILVVVAIIRITRGPKGPAA